MLNFVDLNDFGLAEIKLLVEKAIEIKNNTEKFFGAVSGKVLAGLFFEPSTRTQFSFQTAMFRLGGQFFGFSNPGSSSIAKGESFSDTIKIMSSYADVLVVRHCCDGAARAASFFSSCPVINAGDGVHLHPTQTLTDLITLQEIKHRFNNLKVGICGDLKFGRPVNSLVRALSRFENNEFVFISTEELKISNFLKNFLTSSNCSFVECGSLESVISELDVLYMTRVQRERFKNLNDYEKQKGCFKLTPQILDLASPDLVVLHPLPRVDEIDYEIDNDPRAAYFSQAANGVYARMALILMLLNRGSSETKQIKAAYNRINKVCCNVNCISCLEPHLPKLFVEKAGCLNCAYCDERVS